MCCITMQETEIWRGWRRERSWLCRQEEPSLGLACPAGAMMPHILMVSVVHSWRILW